MRKIAFFLIVAGLSAPVLHAQQRTSHHMTVTIYEDHDIGGRQALIETHDDGTQAVRKIKWATPRNEKYQIIHEDSLMNVLKPYFDAGWEVTASTETVQSGSSEFILRIFLRKEE